MDHGAGRRAREIFLDALELAPGDRRAHIEGATPGDGAVRARALELLEAHGEFEPLFEGLDDRGDVGLESGPGELGPGDSLGGYRVLRTLGSGGFGTVYLAEQTEPIVRRVAIKVLRSGLRTGSARVRFAAERQALARMEHPGIAQVFGADTTEEGLPYFVMEHVPGESLTDYCNGRGLGVIQRLQLFENVCQAVAHAHQRGVLHRDIKPSNVLVLEVDGQPRVKVIDFGVAKAIDGPLTDASLQSVAGELMGTPAYMSPEQAAGELDVDIRADVYGLGALLYELLAGAPPFDAQKLGLVALLRSIAVDEPPTPSARHRSGIDSTGSGRFPVDLDWIAMRCLEKDRGRRYPSASAVASDVRRFLNGHPIEAAPPSAWYRVRKLIRRHRWLTISTAALVLAFVIGFVGIYVGFVRAQSERDVAESILEFLREDMLAAAKPAVQAGRGKDVKLIEVVDVAARRLESGDSAERLQNQPRVRAAIHSTLAELYAALGEYDRSERHMDAALKLFEELGLRNSEEALRGASFQASTFRALGRLDDAIALARWTLQAQTQRLPAASSDVIQTRIRLAFAINAAGNPRRAVELAEDALRDLEASPAPDLQLLGLVHNTLAIAYAGDRRFHLAEEHFREEVALERERAGAESIEYFKALANLAANLQSRGHFGEAIELLSEALAPVREAMGSGHPTVLMLRRNLGVSLVEVGRLEEAHFELDSALRDAEESLGATHLETAAMRGSLGGCLAALGRIDEAGALIRRAYGDTLEISGPDVRATVARRGELISFLHGVGSGDDDLLALARSDFESKERTAGSLHLTTLRAAANLALFLQEAGRVDESEEVYRDSLQKLRRSAGASHPETLATSGSLVDLLRDAGRLEEAEKLAREALAAIESDPPDDPVAIAQSRARLGFVLADGDRISEARELLEEAHTCLQLELGDESVWTRYVHQVMAELGEPD